MHRVNRALRFGLIAACLCAPALVNISISHADPPPPNKATVTIIAPGASSPVTPAPPSNRQFKIYFKGDNKVGRYDFTANQFVYGTGEFSISCEGSVEYDAVSNYYVAITGHADSEGKFIRAYPSNGNKQLYNNRQYSATFKADFTLNGSLLTDTKTVSFWTGDTQPVDPNGPNN